MSKPKWQVDLEAHKLHKQQVDEQLTLEQKASQTRDQLEQLKAEHARFKAALEAIADGGSDHIAHVALGRRKSYEQLAEENHEMAQLIELMEATLRAIRLGEIQAPDLVFQEEHD